MTIEAAKAQMAKRLEREVRPSTMHGDEIVMHDFEAEVLADIIAEFVGAALIALAAQMGVRE